MRRRTLLATAGSLGLGALTAGCLASAPRAERATGGPHSARPDGPASDDGDEPDDSEQEALALAETGTPPTICQTAIQPDVGIYAIVEPAFAPDWSDHEIDTPYQYYGDAPDLVGEQTVIGLARGGRARAYPLSVLDHHEVVNETFGEPLLVTYCPLCSSGMVASRRVRGEPTEFAVSGQLWQPEEILSRASEDAGRTFGAESGVGAAEIRNNGNLVLYDAATLTYWSQLLAQGICGPLAGERLDVRPSTVATWDEWRASHPDTEVLLPPPYSETVAPGEILGATDGIPVRPGGHD